MDLTNMTDEELEQLRVDVLTEQENRSLVESLPRQIEELSSRYKRITGQGEPPVDAAERGVGRNPNA